MSGTQRQNPDGTWSPAEPIPYTNTVDWEVYGTGQIPRRAIAYWHDREIARVEPGRFFGLRFWLTSRRLRRQRGLR